jgi:hypothetical protein
MIPYTVVIVWGSVPGPDKILRLSEVFPTHFWTMRPYTVVIVSGTVPDPDKILRLSEVFPTLL